VLGGVVIVLLTLEPRGLVGVAAKLRYRWVRHRMLVRLQA
jgi:hypothetical protein